jgi:hypothetical protein
MAAMPIEECARRPEPRRRSEWLLHGPGPGRTQPNTRSRREFSRPLTGSPRVRSRSSHPIEHAAKALPAWPAWRRARGRQYRLARHLRGWPLASVDRYCTRRSIGTCRGRRNDPFQAEQRNFRNEGLADGISLTSKPPYKVHSPYVLCPTPIIKIGQEPKQRASIASYSLK